VLASSLGEVMRPAAAFVVVATLVLPSPTDGFHARTPAPLFARRAAIARSAPGVCAASDAAPPARWGADRPPYILNKGPRPQWRGRMMGWVHSTRVWYLLSVAYVAAACLLPTKLPLSPREILLRVMVAAASSANVLISDGYHNLDRRGPSAYTAAAETVWLRLDYLGISCVLTTLNWLWASNLGFPGACAACSWASGVATALVALVARAWVPEKAGHTAAKLIMAFQFVGLLGYLALFAIAGSPACAVNKTIFGIYFPGLLLYVLKWPKSQVRRRLRRSVPPSTHTHHAARVPRRA
jgi:hypothetical protein